ncbi:inositol 2-dehydrogenase [Acidipropionibacterium virtanenii]|uniref:Inositol 2-dehydrogenase n=1 Tax=Acidipropionibacterium virtanenii TaxID=2057246 RepID=A0A344UW78_9ACTN|nr:inositol 2-dehydrogenase [Acidipropionibacterium virtanenii]AXE39526.1 Inositol 2-dehydrogenase [Acidipropionibacterium virtanenii]
MIRIAIIGAGRIGHVHARAVDAHPAAELVLVCDPFEKNAKELSAQYGVRYCLDPQEVFDAPEVDAVIIGSPTRFHVDHILAAVKAGKKVMSEKPIALDVAEAKRCIDELGEAADNVMMGFNRRFDPSFAEIHQRIDDGEIGQLQQLIVVSRDPAAPPAEYVAGSGGIFKDMTIHDFDTVRFFLGDIAEVTAVGTNVDEAIAAQGDFDQVLVTLKSTEGRLATIVNSRSCAFGYDQRLEAFGADGMLSADNLTQTAVRKATSSQTEAKSAVMDFFLERYEDAYRIELGRFIDTADAGTPASPSVRDGYAALLLAQATADSARTGAAVKL